MTEETWKNACTIKIKEICKNKNRPLITVDRHETLKFVLESLSTQNILSVPIVDNKTNQFYGFVDVLDIAGYILATWKKLSYHLDDRHFPSEPFFNAPIMDVLNYSEVDYPVFIDEEKTLQDLIQLFRHPKKFFRLHRAAVTRDGAVVDVISQSDVISFTASKMSEFPNHRANMEIGLIQGLIHSPIMIRIDSNLVDALEKLVKNRISGLALVDHEFKLSGNFSASDLRGINPMAFDFFGGSVLQFLSKGTTGSKKQTVSVGPGNTFSEAIKVLAMEKVHRLYITTKNGNPVGFVTLIDVITRL